ncbi:hypothetical protein GF385_01090 [Candidatus Dependentiae bacterium]|nr:hypothetical protein [Candidatus Dependentiae bacterium]
MKFYLKQNKIKIISAILILSILGFNNLKSMRELSKKFNKLIIGKTKTKYSRKRQKSFEPSEHCRYKEIAENFIKFLNTKAGQYLVLFICEKGTRESLFTLATLEEFCSLPFEKMKELNKKNWIKKTKNKYSSPEKAFNFLEKEIDLRTKFKIILSKTFIENIKKNLTQILKYKIYSFEAYNKTINFLKKNMVFFSETTYLSDALIYKNFKNYKLSLLNKYTKKYTKLESFYELLSKDSLLRSKDSLLRSKDSLLPNLRESYKRLIIETIKNENLDIPEYDETILSYTYFTQVKLYIKSFLELFSYLINDSKLIRSLEL